ncbi:MAG: ABC transporter permease [Actinobacteria bacterium]|nr:MAG: ABC transporter permease [Actinomycetota bacterium]
MWQRLSRIIKKEFLQLRRDRGMLPMLIVLPIVQLMLFGYVVSTDVKDLSMAVIDRDKSAESRQLVSSFSNAGYFDVNYYPDNMAQVTKLLDAGNAIVALTIPNGYADDIAAGRTAVVQVIVDGTESNASSVARNYATLIVGRQSNGIAQTKLRTLTNLGARPPTVDPRVRVLFNPSMKSVNFMVPGLIAFILTLSTISLTSEAIVRERDQGTLEQLIVTPIRRGELILGKLIPYTIVAFVQITLILVVGVFWFGVPFRGSIAFLYFTCLLYVFASLGQGLLISTISKTRQQAMLTTMFAIFPAMLISGFVFPVENMPKLIQIMSYAVPLKYFLVIVRGIFLKGAGWQTLWPQMAALVVFSAVIFTASVTRFQKKFSD